MKNKIDVLNKLSKSIDKLSDLGIVVIVLAIAMVLMQVGWELGRAYARM